MHFFYIDPLKGVIERIEGSPELEQIYELLDCRYIDVVRLPDTYDVFYCDDEGLIRNELKAANTIKTADEQYPDSFIAGRLLYMGTSHEGENMSPDKTFQYNYRFENGMFTQPSADHDKAITCSISRHVNSKIGLGTIPYTMELKGFQDRGFVPVTKTLEEKLNELSAEKLQQQIIDKG